MKYNYSSQSLLLLLCIVNMHLANAESVDVNLYLSAIQKEINDSKNNLSFRFHASSFIDSSESPDVKSRSCIRYLCKRSDDGNIAVLSGIMGTPRSVYFEDVFLALNVDKNLWYSFPGTGWRFRFDRESYAIPLKTSQQFKGGSHQISVELLGFRDEVLGANPSKEVWDPISRSYDQIGKKENHFYLQHRGIVDTKQYGSNLSSVGAINQQWGCTQILGLCTNQIPYATVLVNGLEDLDSDTSKLVATSPSSKVKITLGTISRDDANLSSMNMYRSLRRGAINDDFSPLVLQKVTEAAKLKGLVRHALQRDLVDNTSNTLAFHALADEIELLADNSLNMFENELAYPCDPYMRWLRAEHLLGPEVTNYIYITANSSLLKEHKTSSLARFKLIEAITCLGLPISNFVDRMLYQAYRNDFEEAIYRSRVYKPCSENHIQACKEVLDNVDTVAQIKDVAVHTLALLGSLEIVGPEHINSWIQNRIIESSENRRSRYLDHLLDNEATRKYFRVWITEKKFPIEVVNMIEFKLKLYEVN